MIEDQREFHEALERRKRAARAAKDMGMLLDKITTDLLDYSFDIAL